jgi:hypothetical protein
MAGSAATVMPNRSFNTDPQQRNVASRVVPSPPALDLVRRLLLLALVLAWPICFATSIKWSTRVTLTPGEGSAHLSPATLSQLENAMLAAKRACLAPVEDAVVVIQEVVSEKRAKAAPDSTERTRKVAAALRKLVVLSSGPYEGTLSVNSPSALGSHLTLGTVEVDLVCNRAP